jgi:hypothetical protein
MQVFDKTYQNLPFLPIYLVLLATKIVGNFDFFFQRLAEFNYFYYLCSEFEIIFIWTTGAREHALRSL